jgi:acetate kinase
MRIFALNCGSSSLKSAAIDSSQQRRLLDIRIENIGSAACHMRIDGAEQPLAQSTDLSAAVKLVLEQLRSRTTGTGPPDAIVHRIVHGGERFLRTVRIDDAVLAEVEGLNHLAPLHNPPAVAAVHLARQAFPDVAQVAVFDTAFHATLPSHAREYALPLSVRKRFGIRRYGFHGISHAHVMQSAAAYLQAKPDSLRIISCHLGNGASVAAIERGCSVETSMGMTPLEGLVMGTRAGDLDPGILLELLQSGALDHAEMDALLNKKSGMAGLVGTSDVREIERRAATGDEECRLALAVYSHRVRKYIGAYAAVMGGVDTIAFTGGVGENSSSIREQCLQRMEFLGAVLDQQKNRSVVLSETDACCKISKEASRAHLLVVRADEELAMAREAVALLAAATSAKF